MQDAVDATLAAAGYARYEISAFARPGRECRHNLNYWRFGDYLGIGAGAHGKLSFPDRVVRQLRWKQPQQYLDAVARGAPVQEEREVTRDDAGFEFMLNALRLTDGVPAPLFAERTGFSLSLVARELETAAARGLLETDPTVIRPTAQGRRFLNDLTELFLRDAAACDAASGAAGAAGTAGAAADRAAAIPRPVAPPASKGATR